MFNQYRVVTGRSTFLWKRHGSTCTGSDKFKILVVGAGVSMFTSLHNQSHRLHSTGTGGLNSANQIYNRFKSAGKTLNDGDVAVVDAAESHYYQVRSYMIRYYITFVDIISSAGMVCCVLVRTIFLY